jgi:uncharacterized protein
MSSSAVLVELAREEARLYQIKQQVASLPRRLQELEASQRGVQRQRDECQAIHQKTERERRKLEVELQETMQQRTKAESRQSSITNTQQYQANVREIENLTIRVGGLESAVLEAIERSDEAAKRRDAEMVRLDAEEQRLEALQQQLQRDLERARAELGPQSAQRDAAVSRLDARTRALYERVLRAKGDAGIALVNERTCGICSALQPLQVIQVLHGTDPALQTCQMCGRILVWDPTPR